MARLPAISGPRAVRAFELSGWRVVRQTGSHIIMTKPGDTTVLSVPNHRELKRGTLRGLIRKAGLDVSTFAELVRG
jgi:predicted RNA binding protein YcfA (HicA-like mRNA interferase family)